MPFFFGHICVVQVVRLPGGARLQRVPPNLHAGDDRENRVLSENIGESGFIGADRPCDSERPIDICQGEAKSGTAAMLQQQATRQAETGKCWGLAGAGAGAGAAGQRGAQAHLLAACHGYLACLLPLVLEPGMAQPVLAV